MKIILSEESIDTKSSNGIYRYKKDKLKELAEALLSGELSAEEIFELL